MHKGLLLVLQADADSDGALLCAVLNRPTSVQPSRSEAQPPAAPAVAPQLQPRSGAHGLGPGQG